MAEQKDRPIIQGGSTAHHCIRNHLEATGRPSTRRSIVVNGILICPRISSCRRTNNNVIASPDRNVSKSGEQGGSCIYQTTGIYVLTAQLLQQCIKIQKDSLTILYVSSNSAYNIFKLYLLVYISLHDYHWVLHCHSDILGYLKYLIIKGKVEYVCMNYRSLCWLIDIGSSHISNFWPLTFGPTLSSTIKCIKSSNGSAATNIKSSFQ